MFALKNKLEIRLLRKLWKYNTKKPWWSYFCLFKSNVTPEHYFSSSIYDKIKSKIVQSKKTSYSQLIQFYGRIDETQKDFICRLLQFDLCLINQTDNVPHSRAQKHTKTHTQTHTHTHAHISIGKAIKNEDFSQNYDFVLKKWGRHELYYLLSAMTQCLDFVLLSF